MKSWPLVLLTAWFLLMVFLAQTTRPRVLWCVDDAGRVVPLRPDLVQRGRLVTLPWGVLP